MTLPGRRPYPKKTALFNFGQANQINDLHGPLSESYSAVCGLQHIELKAKKMNRVSDF